MTIRVHLLIVDAVALVGAALAAGAGRVAVVGTALAASAGPAAGLAALRHAAVRFARAAPARA